MKYQSSQSKRVYDIQFDLSKKARYICPECSEQRKNKKAKDLEYYPDTQTAYCFHCSTTMFVYKPFETQQVFTKPEWKNKTQLTDKAVKYFESRMITQDTLNEMKIYSDVEWMPQFQKEVEVFCFPYFRNGELINIKYRGPKKSFKLVSNAELIWYNFDCILEAYELIVCEGEIDCITFVQNGFKNVISVPNGAKSRADYLDNSIELFERIEKIYLATDCDTVGLELKDELIRRFGAEKCYSVNFKGCKDANEYFNKFGGYDFKDILKDAKPIPIAGNVEISSIYNEIIDLYENGVKKGSEIGIEEIDKYCTWELGRLCTVTGIPSCFSKSQLVHTDSGVKKISNLKIGDRVLSYNHDKRINEYRRVIDTSFNKNHSGKMYRIKMKDGSEIKVTDNHRFFTGTEYLQIKDILLSLAFKLKK